jgi:hypothetical protein
MDPRELEIDDVLGTRGSRDRQQIIPAIGAALGIQLAPKFLQQRGEVLTVCSAWKFPINIDAIESILCHELHAGLRELHAGRRVGGDGGEICQCEAPPTEISTRSCG